MKIYKRFKVNLSFVIDDNKEFLNWFYHFKNKHKLTEKLLIEYYKSTIKDK